MGKRPPDSELVFSDFNAEWLNSPSPFDRLDADWIDIIVFFVFHIPVKGISARGTTLGEFHWGEKSKTDDYKLLKRRLMKYAGLKKTQFLCVDKWEAMRLALSDNNLLEFPNEVQLLRLVYRNDKGGICESLCNHIRNSFAHGRLTFYEIEGETYIAMEDIDNQRTVTARMILSKKVLLRWIRIIQYGPFAPEEDLDSVLLVSENKKEGGE